MLVLGKSSVLTALNLGHSVEVLDFVTAFIRSSLKDY